MPTPQSPVPSPYSLPSLMTSRNAATLALLVGIVGALGGVLFARFGGGTPSTVEVRNVDTVTLVVRLSPPGAPPTRCTLAPGETCSSPFTPGMLVSVWIGPGDPADPATWRIESIGGTIDARSDGTAMEVSGDGLKVMLVEP